jgi:hypothetical protein
LNLENNFRQLTSLSTQTAEELIKSNNELIRLRTENKEANEKLSLLNESTNKLVEQVLIKDKLIEQMSLKEEATDNQAEKRVETIRLEYENEMKDLTHKLRDLERQIQSLVIENKNLKETVKSQEEWDDIKQELANVKDKLVTVEAENTSIKQVNTDLKEQNIKLLASVANEKKQYEGLKAEVIKSLIPSWKVRNLNLPKQLLSISIKKN